MFLVTERVQYALLGLQFTYLYCIQLCSDLFSTFVFSYLENMNQLIQIT